MTTATIGDGGSAATPRAQAPAVIVFLCLVTAGMPFNLLIGAAPNAIAYESKQFTSGEFFLYGCIPSVLVMLLLTLFVYVIWPALGMQVLAPVAH
jgi:sodium-dependent dicarboxylate transporter 2/3/5